MRLLNDYEIDLVAGGTNSSEIVVIGEPIYDDEPVDNDNNPDGNWGGGGGGGGGDDMFSWLGPIWDWLTAESAAAEARETSIANKFDPNQVVASSPDGTHKAMADGSMFVDTNGNGKVDLWIKVDTNNHIWKNDGSGWVETMMIRNF